MKYGRFEQQGRIFFGIVDGDSVQEIDAAPWDSHKQTGRRHALSSLKTLVPCIPSNFYCAGLNYLEHLEWGNKRKGTATKPPAKADVGYRSAAPASRKKSRAPCVSCADPARASSTARRYRSTADR